MRQKAQGFLSHCLMVRQNELDILSHFALKKERASGETLSLFLIS